jgi:hypothetical protein
MKSNKALIHNHLQTDSSRAGVALSEPPDGESPERMVRAGNKRGQIDSPPEWYVHKALDS